MDQFNHSSDISPTGGQMPRLIRLAQASKLYRENKINNNEKFSNNGNEIVCGTIGNASAAEGLFFEAVNAAAIIQVPIVLSIYDDGYGISVANDKQMTKGSVSEALAGFQKIDDSTGLEILTVKGWDFTALMKTYSHAENWPGRNIYRSSSCSRTHPTSWPFHIRLTRTLQKQEKIGMGKGIRLYSKIQRMDSGSGDSN